ncbi:MAG TPA: tRNA (pseudouridine(54)-N(1))-methyltransferase TrmY [Methanoregulaceae archaeon]|nr:MAG: tRNA (pseudouridine(54)-N(1))-methyltransferase TrmY [Methanolinea sp.]HON81900.1 tRNA (pseudouridine(54)-N(1))-methyltransferase TrmY [Methanoregulaceae archaeon]HPD10702.1 tRNA (pseudouridine(54)-N(1))-methyltransferase TrmY [Methanoregulaceae archaeon]HRT15831.1 tRNA (pseudouridine(54)-N(1))-methyltransferase TrmY [Methanoregulaceae archaeon]HRU31345.1 tRNA (pseudouridine(54)-N(1))-methyltransferase TrmY [Methanoregulaceae archaeon]
MKRICVIGHHAPSSSDFSVNDLAGGAGRLDILCRCLGSAFFLSHGIRRDIEVFLVLLGPPRPPVTIRFSGAEIRSFNPDERSTGSLIKKALSIPRGDTFRESGPGVAVRKGGLAKLLTEHPFAVLNENGADIRQTAMLPGNVILSDHLNLTAEEEEMVSGCPAYSVGPLSLHANAAITLLLNEHDRRSAGWT